MLNYRMLHIKYVCSSEILNKPIIIIIQEYINGLSIGAAQLVSLEGR